MRGQVTDETSALLSGLKRGKQTPQKGIVELSNLKLEQFW